MELTSPVFRTTWAAPGSSIIRIDLSGHQPLDLLTRASVRCVIGKPSGLEP